MRIGAGTVTAQCAGAADFIDPPPCPVGKSKEAIETYPNIGMILPTMDYGEEQLKDLEATINATECDAVVIGTPVNLARIVDIRKPVTRAPPTWQRRATWTCRASRPTSPDSTGRPDPVAPLRPGGPGGEVRPTDRSCLHSPRSGGQSWNRSHRGDGVDPWLPTLGRWLPCDSTI